MLTFCCFPLLLSLTDLNWWRRLELSSPKFLVCCVTTNIYFPDLFPSFEAFVWNWNTGLYQLVHPLPNSHSCLKSVNEISQCTIFDYPIVASITGKPDIYPHKHTHRNTEQYAEISTPIHKNFFFIIIFYSKKLQIYNTKCHHFKFKPCHCIQHDTILRKWQAFLEQQSEVFLQCFQPLSVHWWEALKLWPFPHWTFVTAALTFSTSLSTWFWAMKHAWLQQICG